MVVKRIPRDEEGFDLLLQSLYEKAVNYKTVLNISDEMLDRLHKNAMAYHEWRMVKVQIAASKKSVTEFVEQLFSGDKKNALPVTPIINLGTPTLPDKPGIEMQTREFIEYLELQDAFTDAIGLDFGFYVNTSDSSSPEDLTINFKVKDYSGYRLDIIFSLHEQDALDLSYRIKGAPNFTKVTATSSPYTLEVPPDPDGLAITLEMYAILIRKNKPVGQTSDVKTVIAHA
jgi:hypothetical protein